MMLKAARGSRELRAVSFWLLNELAKVNPIVLGRPWQEMIFWLRRKADAGGFGHLLRAGNAAEKPTQCPFGKRHWPVFVDVEIEEDGLAATWRLIVGAIGLVALAVGVLAMVYMTAPAAPGPDLARSKTSAKGVFSVEIAPEAGEIKQGELHSWLVTVKTRQGAAVEDAKITIGGGMPEHAHGLPTSPEATAYLGDGRYRIDGMKFSMTGWWQLKFGITAPAGSDEATFNLAL